MSLLLRLFQRTLPPAPTPLRDIDGRFLPQRIAVRARAIDMAQRMGRADLIERLTAPIVSPADVRIMRQLPDGGGLEVVAPVPSNCLPLTPSTADATSAQSNHRQEQAP